ncbi:MAG TPA: UDP-N-acetylmuramate dehydrogenase [Candidatus Paceibacterota bacterium]|nr:UDP-N-acetylmuramate dehydrogenase [Candidatus Paceibacterota bacterium]
MIEVREHIPLASLTTFEIGGAARYFVDVRSDEDIREALSWAQEHGMRFIVFAGGSNVLVPDDGLDALVIHIVGDLYSFKDGMLDSWAGTNLLDAVIAIGTRGFGGWEKLAGIPGTIGGAIRGNAGAFGSEIKDFTTSVRALHTQTGEVRDFSNAECDFSYRHSFFKDHPEWIILRAQISLVSVDPGENASRITETIAERERRHLQNVRAAGSFFMNPTAPQEIVDMFEKEKSVASRESRVPAGWLIEKVGMKGATVGGAIASLQHPNYIVNQNNATAQDVRTLAERIKAAVRERFSIELHEEAAVF